MGLEARLRLARLYLCTDAREKQGDLESFLRAAFAGGVDIVQIRQKGMKPEAELAALEIARQAAAPYQAIVCVNDSADLAGRFQADMLHLGQTDGSATRARRYLHRWALLGRSTHTPRQTDKAIKDGGVDYFCVGPVWTTPTKPGRPAAGLNLLLSLVLAPRWGGYGVAIATTATPRVRSRSRICIDSAGWVTEQASAARPKWPYLASAER